MTKSRRPVASSPVGTTFPNVANSRIEPCRPTSSTRLWCPSVTRNPQKAPVPAYTGPDAITELADQVLRNAKELGIDIPVDAAENHWPEWA